MGWSAVGQRLVEGSQAVSDFRSGVASGAWQGVTSLASGVKDLAVGSYNVVTDPVARDQAVQTATRAIDYGGQFVRDPATRSKAYDTVSQAVGQARDQFSAARDRAAQEGRLAEFYGEVVGRGGFEVGMVLVPVTKIATAAKVAKGVEATNAAVDLTKAVRVGGVLAEAKPAALVATCQKAGTVATANTAKTAATDVSHGVAFFGESNLNYYTREGATLGRDGKAFFLMPLEDSAAVKNASDAARLTGRAPSAEAAYLNGGDIYGLSFPTQGLPLKLPTAADAGEWPHFLEGGHTAVKLGTGPNAGYLVNPTRELVTPGGVGVPNGSVLFKLGPKGEWLPLKRF